MAKEVPCESGHRDRSEKFGSFTCSEIELLTQSIKLLNIDSSDEFGIKVFDNLFLLSPELKVAFSVPADQEFPRDLLAVHATLFSNTLAKVIKLLSQGNYNEYRRTIMQLGKFHSTKVIGIIGFQHFHTVLFVTIQDIMGDNCTILLQRVWLKLFDVLLDALVKVEWERQKSIVISINL